LKLLSMAEKIHTTAGIEVTRKERESVGSLLRRFTQRVRQSGVLVESRKHKFRVAEPNRTARRKSALVRAQDRVRYRKLRKWGKIK
jgi:ribosomal protein S21